MKHYGANIAWTATDGSELFAIGACGAEGDNVIWTLTSDGILTISGKGRMREYVMEGPLWNDEFVYEIDKTVVIEDGVTFIGGYAFCGEHIVEVTIADTVTEIGHSAFVACEDLKKVTISDKVVTIGGAAFEDCKSLTDIEFGKSLKVIDTFAFHDCDSLTEVVIPDTVTTIDHGAFADCDSLERVTFGKSVTELGDRVFAVYTEGEVKVSELVFKGSAPAIDEGAFYGVVAIAYYYPGRTWTANVMQDYGGTIIWKSMNDAEDGILAHGTCGAEGDNLTWELDSEGTLTISGAGAMADYDFENTAPWYRMRKFIKKLVIGDEVTSIGAYAFLECTGLTQVEIPDSVVRIYAGAFELCYNVKKFDIGKNVAEIHDGAFRDGSTEENTPEYYFKGKCPLFSTVAFFGTVGTVYYYYDASWKNIVEEYGGGITWILMADENGIIVSGTFGAEGDNLTWSLNKDGVLNISGTGAMQNFDTSAAVNGYAPWYEYRTLIKKVVIGDQVTTIGSWAFVYCDQINTVQMGRAIERIGSHSFAMCKELTAVRIPNSTTSIGTNAFDQCEKLATVVFGENVNEIHDWAFGIDPGHEGKHEFTFLGSAPLIHAWAFANMPGLAYYYPDGEKTWTKDIMLDYEGNLTWVSLVDRAKEGDSNNDGVVTDADVIYQLWYTVFPEDYDLPGADHNYDYNLDCQITDEDVIYLLWHTVFPEDYPLN